MPTKSKPQPRKPKTTTKKSARPSVVLRELVEQDTERPLLEVLEPNVENDDTWAVKLNWLAERYGISVDILNSRGLGSRSSLHAYRSGDRGANIPEQKLRELADAIGFPMQAWWWSLEEFDQFIRESYPGFAGKFDDSEEEGGSGSSNGYNQNVFTLAA